MTDETSAAPRRPVVFMFQPHRFEAVTPPRLAEWERSITDYFGLPEPYLERDKMLVSATWSDSGDGQICADDSDMHDVAGDIDPSEVAERLAQDVAAGRRPTIFMWQPSRFDPVPPEKLADWERMIREHVGLPTSGFARSVEGSATLSATLPNDCMDDSDMLEA